MSHQGYQLTRSLVAVGLLSTMAALALAQSTLLPDRWWAPGANRVLPSILNYENADGMVQTLLAGDPIHTQDHPFFAPLGANGRGCVTCHQPADAMSLSAATAQERWQTTSGKDPLFAAYDGSNCPTLPQADRNSHSLLLEHGLIRVQRPWPPHDWSDKHVKPDFNIEVVRDPTGCNSGKQYGLQSSAPSISVYRRPRPVANLKYLVAMGFAYDPKQGMPLQLDPETGQPVSGNLMADNRVPTLRAQMADAAATHLEMPGKLSESQRKQIEDFMLRVYSAQVRTENGLPLDSLSARGGPQTLMESSPGQLGSIGTPVWGKEFGPWEKISAEDKAKLPADQRELLESITRGAKVFRDRMFLITDSAGINSPIGFGNPVRNSCVFCHNMTQMGNDVAPGQVDLGTTTLPFADPAPHLPLFKITCLAAPHPHYGREIYTSDPGYALTTGRCADVGKITLQSLRGLSARAPYFSNGSARTLRDVVDYYDRRYSIGYTEQEKQDLVNLMKAL